MEETKLLGTDHSAQDSKALADTDKQPHRKPSTFPCQIERVIQYESVQRRGRRAAPRLFPPRTMCTLGANSGKSGVNQAISRDLFLR